MTRDTIVTRSETVARALPSPRELVPSVDSLGAGWSIGTQDSHIIPGDTTFHPIHMEPTWHQFNPGPFYRDQYTHNVNTVLVPVSGRVGAVEIQIAGVYQVSVSANGSAYPGVGTPWFTVLPANNVGFLDTFDWSGLLNMQGFGQASVTGLMSCEVGDQLVPGVGWADQQMQVYHLYFTGLLTSLPRVIPNPPT